MTRIHACCLVIASMAGCVDRPAATGPGNTATPVTSAAPVAFDRKPEVLLSSRKPDRLIVAIDFAGSRAVDPSVPLDDRRAYVLEQSVTLYAAFARKERDDQPVRL